MFAISSPSGAGKTSLCHRLLESCDNLELSISVTTRPKRDNEAEKIAYHFINKEEFDAMRDAGDLIEHAQVFSNWYGTPREPVERALSMGWDILFDIDWQGVRQLKKWRPEDLVTLFLLPPDGKELERRLTTRAQDTKDTIRERMKMAAKEISHYDEYDYIWVNHDLRKSVEAARIILQAERSRRERQTGLGDFAKDLKKQL